MKKKGKIKNSKKESDLERAKSVNILSSVYTFSPLHVNEHTSVLSIIPCVIPKDIACVGGRDFFRWDP